MTLQPVPLQPRGDYSTDPFAAQDPSGWIPTNGSENLPPERQVVAVLHSLQPQYRFERVNLVERIAHVVPWDESGDGHRYWRIHGDQPGMLTMLAHVLFWYPLPGIPTEEGPQ